MAGSLLAGLAHLNLQHACESTAAPTDAADGECADASDAVVFEAFKNISLNASDAIAHTNGRMRRMTNEIQRQGGEQSRQIAKLEQQNTELKQQMEQMEQQNTEMKQQMSAILAAVQQTRP
jgi:septal ring factor EnvC (AmiA/AmiB activator)